MVTELQSWNSKVQKGLSKPYIKTETCRNKFIYTSLRNIILGSTQGSENYEKNLDKLYEWFKKNSEDSMPMYFSARKKGSVQDDDWKVR
jgi:hypothetical protein